MFSLPGASPWAAGATESADYLVDVALGCHSSGWVAQWSPPDEFDEAEAASLIPDHPNVWTDGSLVLDQVTVVSSSGAGFFAHQSENCWSGRRWSHVDGVRAVGEVSCCRGFCSVPGLFSLFKEPQCGVSFWLCRPLVRFTLVLIIWVLFVMLVVCWLFLGGESC